MTGKVRYEVVLLSSLLIHLLYFLQTGPLTEVHLPIDNITKKVKGYAFITFMMPEHAVKAYAELDGTVFLVSKML